MLAHVPSFGPNPRSTPDFLAYPVPKACMHVLGTGVPRRLGVARSASSPKAAQTLGCSLTPGLRISFGRVTCMARAASVPGLRTLGFLLLCGVCVWVQVVFGLGFRLRPATPGLGDELGVCLCACSACTPPLLAGVCGVGVCALARVSAVPRRSWLGCWGVCVFMCPLRLYPATPGWGVWCGCVCLGSGFGCAPPLLVGVLGCVCVFVCALRLYPAIPSWGAWCVCVCLGSGFGCAPRLLSWVLGDACSCARPAYTPPLLAGVCGVDVCALAWVLAAPRHSWLGCWGVCVLVCPLRLYPATPGRGVWCGCVCLGSGFGCAPPLLAGVLGCVCVGVRAPLAPRHSYLGFAAWLCVLWLGFRLRPATPGWGVWCGHVCLGSGFGCAPRLLAWPLGCVCVLVRPPLVPCHSWLGCAAWVCVLELGSGLRPATRGWGVGVCVCSCARSACSTPLLAGVCGAWVCVWARVSAAPRHSWPGCWGLCVFVCPLRL